MKERTLNFVIFFLFMVVVFVTFATLGRNLPRERHDIVVEIEYPSEDGTYVSSKESLTLRGEVTKEAILKEIFSRFPEVKSKIIVRSISERKKDSILTY